MRKKLCESFDEIYILNLHGNSRIGEKAPDGSKDENVFDIQQGVAIALFIKKEKQGKACRIFYKDVQGLRENKYDYLSKFSNRTTKWNKLRPVEPNYFLVEKDFTLKSNYDKFISLTEVFDRYSSGVKTHRDHFVIGFSKKEVEQRMQTFASDLPDDLVAQTFHLEETTDWNIRDARESVKEMDWRTHIKPYSYRPFDNRYICYLSNLIDRDRMNMMRNFFEDNLGLCLKRSRFMKVFDFKHAFAISHIMDLNFLGDQSYLFPLYIYAEKEKAKKKLSSNVMMLFEPEADYGAKKPNLSAVVVGILTKAYRKTPSPEEILYYIYGVLYSDTYRTKYAEFLKIDFPRVPFTKDYKLFKKMAEYGNRLVDLHLLKSPELNSPVAKFQGKGENRVEKPRYDEKAGYVYISKTQYFEGISQNVWSYQIGGYQVCDKWLKDRKGRILSLDEIQTYCRIATAIEKTIDIQKAIDGLYAEVEKDIL